MNEIITVRGLTKSFADGEKKVTALNGVDLTVYEGDIFGVIGLSGAGKSTFVRCLNRLEEPDEGSIIINGQDVRELSEKELNIARRNIGMIFQQFNLLSQASILDNVCFPMEIAHWKKADAKKRALELIKLVGRAGRENAYPAQLSGGMKQRVGIARAFVSKPRVIFADEPTGNLDSITSKQVLYRMLQISKQMGTTFVMVTHEPELASCADRIITILDGKVQSDVVQDPATKERNREALFASLEGNMRIGGDSASGEVHQKTAAELASYAAPAAAAQQPEQPKP